MTVTNNLARVHRRMRKFHNWQRNSIPFLSGDAFADSADFQAFPPRLRFNQNSKSSVSDAKVIFCPSHFAKEFVDDNFKSITAKVLIFGNSDEEFQDLDFSLPSSVRHVFVQNYLSKNSEIISGIPIGLENLRLGNNGRPKLIRNSNKVDKGRILIGPFSMTHEERKEFEVDELLADSRIEYLGGRISPERYSRLVQDFKLIACPRGNGIDTHRFWETLYRGSIPIVKDSVWIKNFEFLQGRVAITQSWGLSDLLSVIEKDNYLKFNPQNIQELWWPYWQSRISSYL